MNKNESNQESEIVFARQNALREEEWKKELKSMSSKNGKFEVLSDKGSFIDGLVISILGIVALANSAYAIVAPFLPFEFEEKGID
mmetsp:Transcript_16097/g.27197  ORF Transcript_16097/g.27197 Transcript_16097/m.27197 type:complete len:85 (+) Transcript_16097:178-432(+)